MTDIVERLRDNAPADHGLASGDLMREAAAEIEQLRISERQWQATHPPQTMTNHDRADLINRLRFPHITMLADNSIWLDAAHYRGVMLDAADELERLSRIVADMRLDTLRAP
jgi:hypothetical protein